MKKFVIFVVALAVIGTGTYLLFFRSGAAAEGQFQFVEVTRGDLEEVVTCSGVLQAVGTVELGTQVSGTIAGIYADFNDKVHAGQLLAVLDTALLKASVRDNEASLARAEAELSQAQAEHNRNTQLYERGHISEQNFIVSETEVETAKASVQSSQAQLERARTNLDYAYIYSPIDGTILERTIEVGQTVAASFSTPQLFIIAEDLSVMEIEASVDENDIGQIREGQTARFTVQTYPDDIFHGTVRQVRLQPTTVQNVVCYTVIIDAENNEGLLLPGMTATVDFITTQIKDALLVPNSALRFQPTEEMMAGFMERMQQRRDNLPDSVKEQRRQMMANQSGAAGGSGMPYGGSTSSGKVSRLWLVDENGALMARMVQTGATDGKLTEIIMGRGIEEGTRVISSLSSNGDTQSGSTEDRPPRFGPMF